MGPARMIAGELDTQTRKGVWGAGPIDRRSFFQTAMVNIDHPRGLADGTIDDR